MTAAMVAALQALQSGDRERARRLSQRATGSALGQALSAFLSAHSEESSSVYTEPSAFQAFISGGGNVGLYAATATALAAAYDRTSAGSVLDLGSGDGRALIAAAVLSRDRRPHFDLVEPSAVLPSSATSQLRALDIDALAHAMTAQQFARDVPNGRRWDVAESTFALHTLPTEEREQVLRELRGHVHELVIVEFDVPDTHVGSEDHLRFLADTYELGLSEYGADRNLVADGCLIPVLIGQLAPDAARMTFEQPAAAWAKQLTRCGYSNVTCSELYPYWSSAAFVLTARGTANAADGDARESFEVALSLRS
jgi:hypothetical protein